MLASENRKSSFGGDATEVEYEPIEGKGSSEWRYTDANSRP